MRSIDRPAELPSVDRLVNGPDAACLVREYGAPLVTRCARNVLAAARDRVLAGGSIEAGDLLAALSEEAARTVAPSLRRVINLTGTVLHTNLGRAALPASAIEAMVGVARGASSLEFDLATGKRGDRHRHAEPLLCQLTGAERALVVNNNSAAVLLTLNTLARRKEVPVSRGELVEIGGAFRMPDIMARAGCKLVEVGTTNRTHERDFENAIGTRTALLMKVHTSNYEVRGFTRSVGETALARIARQHGVPFVTDLGSGSLVDLGDFGLPHEPTVRESLAAGADLVTFSGDKLLGGPQAGIVAGRADFVERIRKNPMHRAFRLDKLRIAALDATLALYSRSETLAETVPALRWLARPPADIRAVAERVAAELAAATPKGWRVEVADCLSQIGSGALPAEALPSVAVRLMPEFGRPKMGKKAAGRALRDMAAAFRALPVPAIGRVGEGAFWLDMRCLERPEALLGQIDGLAWPSPP